MGNNAVKCERGQFSEKQFEQLKETYALLASNDKLINEDAFVASFAKYGAKRKQFGRELSMFLKSSCTFMCLLSWRVCTTPT